MFVSRKARWERERGPREGRKATHCVFPGPSGGLYRPSVHGSPLGSRRHHGSLPLDRRHGRSSQTVDPAQDRGEQGARHRHLGQLDTSIYGSDMVMAAIAEVMLRPAGYRLSG
jgi:hypothetical protein